MALPEEGAVYHEYNQDRTCPGCLDPDPYLVCDFANGDMICEGCGTVVGDRVVDLRSEKRTIKNDDSGFNDPSRTGAAADPLLDDAGLSVKIGKVPGGDTSFNNIARLNDKGSLGSSDRALLHAYNEIQRFAENMELPARITDHAKKVFKTLAEKEKTMRGRSLDGLTAAVLYIACRDQKVPRTLKEICAVTNVPKKDIGRAYKHITNTLQTNLETIKTVDYLSRFVNSLGLPIEVAKGAEYIAERASEIGCVDSKSPISVAAAAVWIMVLLLDIKTKSIRDIAEHTGVSEVTIRSAYKAMHKYRDELVSDDYSAYMSRLPE